MTTAMAARTARGLLVPLACAVLVLGGCGGDESAGDSADDTASSTSGDASADGGTSDDTSPDDDPSSDESDDTGTDGEADDEPDDAGGDDHGDEHEGDGGEHDDHGEHAAPECVGEQSGPITLTAGEDTSLPGGSTAAVGSTDLEADPPVASLALGESTRIERDNASALTVGDQFGLQRAVYKVIGICDGEVVLDEF